MSQLVIPALDITPPEEGEKFYACRTCGQQHVRMTAMLDATCPKYALVPWAEQIGLANGYAAAKADVPLEKAKDWAKDQARNADSKKLEGGTRGTAIHAFLEAYAKTGEVAPIADLPVEHRGYGKSLSNFLLDYNPEFIASEFYIAHHDLGYAGKSDGICLINEQPPRRNKPIDLTGKTVLFDLKSNREGRVYPPAMLYQLAGYELAWRDMGGRPNDHQIVVAVGESSYQVMVSYFRPEAFIPLANFYFSQREEAARNPNARGAT